MEVSVMTVNVMVSSIMVVSVMEISVMEINILVAAGSVEELVCKSSRYQCPYLLLLV